MVLSRTITSRLMQSTRRVSQRRRYATSGSRKASRISRHSYRGDLRNATVSYRKFSTGYLARMSDAIPLHANAPECFRRALAVAYTEHAIEVDGASIHYLAWGEPGREGLVFVHGGGGPPHWWTHVAARFAEEFRVLAVDLSGHGDSDHRDGYELEQWTNEVVAVAIDGQIAGRPVVIGHSMGGFVTIGTGALHGDRLGGVIVC